MSTPSYEIFFSVKFNDKVISTQFPSFQLVWFFWFEPRKLIFKKCTKFDSVLIRFLIAMGEFV